MRDEWLHRGPALYDMDLNTYVSHVEREEKPWLHAATSSHRQGDTHLLVPFDAHYKLAGHYAQRVKLRCTVITRYVGPNFEREAMNQGRRMLLAKLSIVLCFVVRGRDSVQIL